MRQISHLRRLIPQDVGGSGGNHFAMWAGEHDGHEIFIKSCSLSHRRRSGLSEASFARLMSDFQLGPHFHGVVIESGKITGFATDFIDGEPYKLPDLRGSLRDCAEAINTFLYDVGLYPADLQFRLDRKNRLWVVDTGRFHVGQFPSQRSLSKDPRKFTQMLNKVLQCAVKGAKPGKGRLGR